MFVEVLDRHGDVKTRSRIEGGRFSIGRAYDNDLILDDPFIAAHHLLIVRNEDGFLQAQDLESLNGLHAAVGRTETVDVTDDLRIRIGHTQLRFRSDSFPVPDAIPMTAAPSLIRNALNFYIAFLAATGLLALEAHLTSFGEPKPAQLIAAVLATLLGAFAWAGFWSFAGRIATRRANFYAHGAATMAALAALLLVNTLSEYIEFSISDWLAEAFLRIAIAAIVIALLYRQLRLVSRISTRSAALSVAALVAVLLGSSWLVEYATDIGYSSRLDYPAALKAPPFRLSDGVTPEVFADRANALREKLESLRLSD